jgi:hypothetical protein
LTASTPCVGASGDGTITSSRTPASTVLAPACGGGGAGWGWGRGRIKRG